MLILKTWRCWNFAAIVAVSSTMGFADNWPQFRGADSNGVAPSQCPTSWDASKNVRWKVAVSGETVYQQRIPGTRAFWASPWTSGGRVFCLDASGTTIVLAGGPEFKVLSSNKIDEQSWSSPAVSDGALYLRTIEHLYCIAQDVQSND